MPELPEVEITARRLSAALAGAEIESVLTPGMVAVKSVTPPITEIVGCGFATVRRIGKMFVLDLSSEQSLLIHLMSAGRLQVFDKRASLKDRRSRILIRLADGRELRLREFGTKQRAWAKLLATSKVEADEMIATLGPEAWPAPPLAELAKAIALPRHLHPMLRDQRVISGIGRSWVDEILWEAKLAPFKKGKDLAADEVERLHGGLAVLGSAIDEYEQANRRAGARQAADAAQGAPPRGGALPALWHDDRGRFLRRAPDQLLPAVPNRWTRARRPATVAVAEVEARLRAAASFICVRVRAGG